jgi:polysaccharide deacetylase family protein (PEP-CTERM system associated)
MSPDDFRADLRKSKRIIEDVSSQPVKGYRAPTFSISKEREWAFGILAEEGFLYDSSVFPIRHDTYGWSSFPRHFVRRRENIVEFPISTVRILGINLPFSGGGYLRLLPLALIRAGFLRVNILEKKPVILYVHPWEIDPDQPRVQVTGLSALRHYTNLGKTEYKLRSLIEGFSFGRMDEHLIESLRRG